MKNWTSVTDEIAWDYFRTQSNTEKIKESEGASTTDSREKLLQMSLK